MPFVPLEFTPARIAGSLGPGSGYLNGHLRLDNKTFYEDTYSNLPLVEQKKFWGTKSIVTKSVRGVSVGISGGKLFAQAAQGAIKGTMLGLAKLGVQRIVRKVIDFQLKNINLDALQSSTSLDATLYGLNGYDTYNLYMLDFQNDANIFFINAGIGAVTGASLNLVFIGYFPSIPYGMSLFDLPEYIWDCSNKAVACAVVGDAAVGLIMPGGSISFISS